MPDYVELLNQKDREIEDYKYDLALAKKVIIELTSNSRHCANCGTNSLIDTHSTNYEAVETQQNESSNIDNGIYINNGDTKLNNKDTYLKNKNALLSKQIKFSMDKLDSTKKFETKLSEKLFNNKHFSSFCANNDLIANDNKGILDKKNLNLVKFIEKKLKHKISKKTIFKGMRNINHSNSIINISGSCCNFIINYL